MKNMFKFAPDSITVNGRKFTAEYIRAASGAMTIFVTLDESDHDKDAVITVTPDDPNFNAVIAAAGEVAQAPDTPEQAPSDGERPATIPADYTAVTTDAGNIIAVETHIDATAPEATQPEPAAIPAPDTQEPDEAARDPKTARGPIPEKTFIGTEIPFKTGKILFDAVAERTRVIFDDAPDADAVQKAVAAGFFYSPRTKSYNKKLTFRAYRAAVALAAVLNA